MDMINSLKGFVQHLIVDETMMPFYRPGDRVFGKAVALNTINRYNKQDCIVELISGEILLRKLVKTSVRGSYDLLATNPSCNVIVGDTCLYNVKLASVAPVEWICRLLPPIKDWKELKELVSAGFTVTELSKLLKVPRRTLQHWVSGDAQKTPSPALCRKVLCLWCDFKNGYINLDKNK